MWPFKNLHVHFFLLILSITIFFSCHKDKVSKTQVNFYLADSPFPYDEVNIDFRSVSIKTNANKNEIPFTLTRTGIYNILNFTNGTDTLLASYLTPVGNLSQVHIIIGDTNNIKINGQTFSLLLPKGFESGYVLNFNQKILDGQ